MQSPYKILVVVSLSAFFVMMASGAAEPESCTFKNQPMQPGDEVTQSVEYKMTMQGTLVERGKRRTTAYESAHRQRRHLKVLPREEPSVPRTLVTFEQAEQVALREGVEFSKQEPVDGKTYLLARHGDQLIVTDGEGNEPPQAEYQFVVATMDAFGRVNPLSQFLDGQQVGIGARLRLPNDVTDSLFAAWREAIPNAGVELTLVEIDRSRGPATAVFLTSVRGNPKKRGGASARLDGQLMVEIDTCRVTGIELAGPVRLAEVQKTASGTAELDCQGTIAIALHTEPGVERR